MNVERNPKQMQDGRQVGETQARFFIALLPPQAIQEYANATIQELGDRFQMRTAHAPPHVTLQAPFVWSRSRLPELDRVLTQFAAAHSAIPVALSGFGSFAPRVLYINVLKTAELLALQADLSQVLKTTLAIVDPKATQRSFAPHLTVASRNVTRQTFRQAWHELQSREVSFDFVGDRLTLLIHDGRRWQIHQHYPLIG